VQLIDSNRMAPSSRRSKRTRTVVGILALSGLIVGVASAFGLRVNWTESMPRGIYQRVQPVLERGAWVAVCVDGDAAELARERGYVIDGSCPSGLTPIFKRLAAVPGDRVRIERDGVAVNGAPVPGSELKEFDSRGRSLEPIAQGEFLLTEGQFFVMGMNSPRSWDSRYFGAVSAHQIIAGARPLWRF
jgi:conjugative transfer signal peptidase TraF